MGPYPKDQPAAVEYEFDTLDEDVDDHPGIYGANTTAPPVVITVPPVIAASIPLAATRLPLRDISAEVEDVDEDTVLPPQPNSNKFFVEITTEACWPPFHL